MFGLRFDLEDFFVGVLSFLLEVFVSDILDVEESSLENEGEGVGMIVT